MVPLSILCSLDSFLAGAGLSLAGCPNHYRRRLTFSFIAWDTLAALSGAWLRVQIPAAAIALALMASLLILLGAKKKPMLYLLIPVLLGVDNFAAGALRGTTSLGSLALLGGLCSGIAAWTGLLVGRRALRGLPQTSAWLAGAVAFCVAFLA
jgi:hypothetical protein